MNLDNQRAWNNREPHAILYRVTFRATGRNDDGTALDGADVTMRISESVRRTVEDKRYESTGNEWNPDPLVYTDEDLKNLSAVHRDMVQQALDAVQPLLSRFHGASVGIQIFDRKVDPVLRRIIREHKQGAYNEQD